MLTEKDIGIVIATYNRPDDVKVTLESLRKNKNIPGKIIVVDQTKKPDTKKVVESYKKKLPVSYVFSSTPSSSISKNIGINMLKGKFKLILILDDDVDLLPGYFKEALKEFNANPNLIGLGGSDTSLMHQSSKSKLASAWFKLFFLPHLENDKFRIIGPYGNTASPTVIKPIRDAEWLPGFNMLYRREVFSDYKMPESRGYNVLEDIDSSYHTFKKYGTGSLVITPNCKTKHRFSPTARYAEKKRIFVNHEDHFYFYYAYFNSLTADFKLVWSVTGILLGLAARACVAPNSNNWNALKYNFQAVLYCIRNKKQIRKGNLRLFLNEDLSLKEKYL